MLRFILLIFFIVVILYIYDRNIPILDKLNLDYLQSILQSIFTYLDKILFGIENFENNTKTHLQLKINKNIIYKVPEINCLTSSFHKLQDIIHKYKNDTYSYYLGQNVRLDYYFNNIQTRIEAVYNDDKPNLQMSYLIDIQHKILKIIHDLIFTTPGSDLPHDVLELEQEFKDCFHKINNKLTKYNNTKFIYQDKNKKSINTNSGFIDYPDQPLAKNTYYDNFGFY